MGVDSLVVMLLIDALIATLVITALLTVLWLVLHVLVRRWRHQVQARSQVVQSRLEAIKGDARGFQQEADRYSVDDPEPYGSIARELHETLISIRQAYSKLIGQSNRLMTDDLLLAGNLVSRLLVGFWREPRQWRQRVGEWVVLDASVQELAPQTAHAASMVERLHQLPAQIHDQVLDLHQATAESLQIAQALDDRGVHGDTLTSITAHVHELQASLAALLTVLEGDTDRPTTETPTKKDIATAWRTLREIRRPLGTHLKKLGQYQSTHKDIAENLKTALRVMQTAAETLDGLPSFFDSSRLAAGLREVHAEVTALEKAFLSPAVQDLAAIAKRLAHATEEGRRLIRQAEDVEARFEHFRQIIGAGATLLHQVEAKMNQVARAREHPLVWGEYQTELERLRRVEGSIGVVTAPWGPDHIDENTARATQFAQEVRTLKDQVADTLIQRDHLMRLLIQPELSYPSGWLTLAEEFQGQIGASSPTPAEWPRDLATPTTLNDARQLAQRQRQWVPLHASDPLQASQIERQLAKVQALAVDLDSFRRRLQLIANALRSRELESSRQPIERFVRRMKDATPSLNAKTANHLRRLGRLERRSRKLGSNADHSGTRMIRERAKQIEDWTRSCQKNLHALTQALQAEIRTVETEIRNEIQSLQGWAPFDREPVMKEALRLLEDHHLAPPAPSDQAGTQGEGQIRSLIDQADQLLRERQDLYKAHGNLRSQIRDQVQNRFSALEKKRDRGQRKLEELRKLKKANRADWPPLICDTKWAKDRMEQAQHGESRVRNAGRAVSGVIRLLNRQSESYDRVIADMEAQNSRVRQERQDLQELLHQLHRWMDQLKAYRGFNYQDRGIAQAIGARLSEIDRSLRNEKRSRGRPLTYGEARQLLKRLWALAHDRDLPLQGGQAIRVVDIEAR